MGGAVSTVPEPDHMAGPSTSTLPALDAHLRGQLSEEPIARQRQPP